MTESVGPARPVIAHRGASGYAPENTLAAFELAEKQGADAFELDVREPSQLASMRDVPAERAYDVFGAHPA